MNGIGWVCDECGKTEVVPGDAFNYGGPHNAPQPDGWYLLFKAQPIPAAASDRWEFCSTACIHAQTKPDPGACLNCGNPMREHGPMADCFPSSPT